MNPAIWLPAVIALAAAGVPSTIAAWASRRKNRADTEATVSATYHSIVEELRVELTRREADCNRRISAVEDELTSKLGAMQAHVADLEGMIRTLGGHPPDYHLGAWWGR